MEILISKENFKYEVIKYVEGLFINLFGEDIELEDFYYSRKNFGNFALTYYYKPKDLMLIFSEERLYFEVLIRRKDGIDTWIDTIAEHDPELKGIELPETSIRKFSVIDCYMNLLKRILEENRVKFYKFENSKWVPVDD